MVLNELINIQQIWPNKNGKNYKNHFGVENSNNIKRLTKTLYIGKLYIKQLHKMMKVLYIKFIRDSAKTILDMRKLKMVDHSI